MTESITPAQVSFIQSLQSDKAYKATAEVDLIAVRFAVRPAVENALTAVLEGLREARDLPDSIRALASNLPAINDMPSTTPEERKARGDARKALRSEMTDIYVKMWLNSHAEKIAMLTVDAETLTNSDASRVIDLLKKL